jgi:23S rRNA (cytosine1962-C5)-methyltransferase
MFASVIISASAAKKLESGYPWVFERDVLSRRFEMAGIVAVQNKRGRFLGQAFYSPKSKIALRFITKSKAALDKEFWRKRVLDAFYRRSPKKASDAFRGVYAESDGIPSVIIDKYNDIFAMQITSAGAETIKSELIDIIVEEFKPAAVIEKNNVEVRKLEGLQLIEKVVYGKKTTTVIQEGDQKFEVDVLHGQKTGAYLDYRGFRLKARELIRGNDLKVLDLFCYQGWLACHIAGSGGRKIVAVDSSESAIIAARRNAELNGIKVCHSRESGNPLYAGDPRLRGDDNCIEFICADVFEYLREKGARHLFDFIHLDPPSFAKARVDLQASIKGYRKLIKAAIKLLKSGGVLFASSCSHHISENLLEKIVRDAAAGAYAKCDIIYRGIQDKDHPVLKGFPESLYLKAIAAKVEPPDHVAK